MGARLAPVVVFVVALAAYVRTLMPGQAFDDWGEMQTVPHVLGIAHPTGYPTYILAAHLFELIPIGSIAYRANLFSGVLVALAMATLTWTAIRLGVRPVIAGAAALATGAVGTVWAAATVAEVNPLHLALIALLLDRSLAWADSKHPLDLALVGLITGLSLGNHLLTLFVAPFLGLFVLWSGRRAIIERPLLLLLPIATLLLGLTVYLYIPLAARSNPPLPYNHPTTLDGFLFLVTGTQFRSQETAFLGLDGLRTLVDSLPALLGLMLDRGAVVVPVLGFVGLGVLVVRRPSLGLPLIAILFVNALFWANYQQLEHYLLVPFLILGVGMAVALEAIARTGEQRLSRGVGRTAGLATVTAGVIAVVTVAAASLPAADRSSDHSGDEYVATMGAQLPQNAAIFSFWGASTPLWHYQLVLGQRPDILVVDDTNIVYETTGTREQRMLQLICQRPVFIVRPFAEELIPTRAEFTLEPAFTVTVGIGGPSGTYPLTVYHAIAPAGTCP
jgi:hypothetical protein